MIAFRSPELDTSAQQPTLLAVQAAVSDLQTAVENLSPGGGGGADVGLATYAAGTNVVFLDAGQSNIVGNGNAGTYSGDPVASSQFWNAANSDFEVIDIGTNFRDTNSPILHLAAALEAAYPALNFFFIDAAEGATAFKKEQGSEEGYGAWGKGQDLRRSLTSQISDGLEALAAQGDFVLQGFIFGQGEADAANIVFANGYKDAINEFFDEIRALTRYDLPVYAIRLNVNAIYTYTNVVRQAQEESSATIVNVDDFQLFTDNVHYTPTSYQQIGNRLFDVLSANTGITFGSGAAQLPARAQVDFDAEGGVPSDWTSVNITATAQTGYVELEGTGADGLGVSYIHSPELPFNKPIEIQFRAVADDYAVGLTANPDGWPLRETLDSLVFVKSATPQLQYGNTAIASFPALTDGNSYKARFRKLGDHVVFELLELLSSEWEMIGFYVVLGAALTVSSCVMFDAAVGNPQAVSVRNEDYEANLNIETVRFAQLSDGSAEGTTFAQYQVLDNLVTEMKTTNVLWTYVQMMWFPVGQNVAAALRCIKHPRGAGFSLRNVGAVPFADTHWNGQTLAGDTDRRLDTGISVADLDGLNNHLMVGSSTAGQTLLSRDMGGAVSSNTYMLFTNSSGANFFSFTAGKAARDVTLADTDGVFVCSSLNDQIRIARDGTQLRAEAVTPTPQNVAPEPLTVFRDCRKSLYAASSGTGFPSPGVIGLYTTAIANANTARAAL